MQKNPTLTMDALIAAVRQFAAANYENDGWDYVVEAWANEDIQKEIGASRTAKGAIHKVWRAVKLVDSVRRDVQGA